MSMARWRPSPLMQASFAVHGLAVPVLLSTPALWPWVLAVLAANHGVLTLTGVWPRSHWLGANWTRLPPSAGNAVAITIDDGPDPAVTPQVLNILDQHGAKATFFCIGTRAAQHPELVRDIVRRGHTVENHTQHHAHSFSCSGLAGYTREIEAAQRTLGGITGRTPRFFRAPAGIRSPLLDPVLHKLGLHLVSWTRRGFDTRVSDATAVARRLLAGLAPGAILLLHDGNSARTAAGEPVILAVLPGLLEAVADRQLRPVTLAEALPVRS